MDGTTEKTQQIVTVSSLLKLDTIRKKKKKKKKKKNKNKKKNKKKKKKKNKNKKNKKKKSLQRASGCTGKTVLEVYPRKRKKTG